MSLLLDTGEAFTGDLTLPWMATEESLKQVLSSWQRLEDAGATRVYGGHAGPRPLR